MHVKVQLFLVPPINPLLTGSHIPNLFRWMANNHLNLKMFNIQQNMSGVKVTNESIFGIFYSEVHQPPKYLYKLIVDALKKKLISTNQTNVLDHLNQFTP